MNEINAISIPNSVKIIKLFFKNRLMSNQPTLKKMIPQKLTDTAPNKTNGNC